MILGGRVMDPETNFDAVRNVGVRDGKIVMITENKIAGDEVIDAKGHVVAPGFIDQIRVNLERARWVMQFDVGRNLVLVNVAS